MTEIRISEAVWQRIWLESAMSINAEVCGAIVSGTEYVAMKNRASDPRLAYAYDTFDQKYVWGKWDRRFPLILFHSHPIGKAYPSELDIEYARNKGVLYLIFSLRENRARLFEIENLKVTEVKFEVSREPTDGGHHPQWIIAPSQKGGTDKCVCGQPVPRLNLDQVEEWWTEHIKNSRKDETIYPDGN